MPTGRAMFPDLPVMVAPTRSPWYHLHLLPEAAITVQRVTLTSAGLTATVPLARHFVLTGTLLPVGMTKGVRIVARDRGTGIVAPPTSAMVNEQGGYAVSVDPERQYELVAEPPAGSGLALTVLDDFKEIHSAQPSPAPDYTVAMGFSFMGQVRAEGRVIDLLRFHRRCTGTGVLRGVSVVAWIRTWPSRRPSPRPPEPSRYLAAPPLAKVVIPRRLVTNE